MKVEEIVNRLKYFDGNSSSALREAIDQKEFIIPELLELLSDAIAKAPELRHNLDYWGNISAIYLLAQLLPWDHPQHHKIP